MSISILVLCLAVLSSPALCAPLGMQAVLGTASDCGKPNAPCGNALPAGTNCPQGKGYCQPGYYCGTGEANYLAPARCLPVPSKCGTAGNPCCPSNAEKPHNTEKDKLDSKPFCKDGSTCFYVAPMRGWGDFHAGTTGLPCQAVPKDCGTGPDTPCCPVPNHMEANPPLKRMGCPTNTFCGSKAPEGPSKTNVCIPNATDCGQFGKSCCVFGPGIYGPSFKCGGGFVGNTDGSSGPKGYCANPPGFKGTGQAPLKDLICTRCPEKLDPSLEKTNPQMYANCK